MGSKSPGDKPSEAHSFTMSLAGSLEELASPMLPNARGAHGKEIL